MATWWFPQRIEATVTRAFVVQQLFPDQIERLDRSVAFGGGDLTERTYWESIQTQAKRLFLILTELGFPDHIFTIIDNGWDDAELPLPLEHVGRLRLTASRDDRVDRKFYQRQFHYLVRPLERGEHTVYTEQDIVPVDVVERSSGLAGKASQVDRVRLPNHPSRLLCRRRYALGNGPGSVLPQDFFDAINSVKGFRNDHIVSYWSSYTHQGYGYVLLTPFCDFNLKSFLATAPASYKNLAKHERRELVLNWILCLVDTLCFLHSQNRSHRYIKPSTVLFTNQNHIFFADSARLSPDSWSGHADKSSFDREWYDYAAPEQWFRPTGPASPPLRKPNLGSSPEGPGFSIPRVLEQSGTPNAMLHTPTPQLNPQHADIFSLGCVILELLSFLVKRSSSKFASFRSAKHKTAGRGGAVLDTSFHKNLGQVEAWMSSLAKDASKKVADAEGGNIFRGITPMLHVVTGMLSANPQDRPAALEVQQRMYQILTDTCCIPEPHCVHQYSNNLQYSLGRLRIGDAPPTMADPAGGRNRANPSQGPPRAYNHTRSGSSSGYSQGSGTSSASRSSNDRDMNPSYSGGRSIPASQASRAPPGWPGIATTSPYIAGPNGQASMYAAAQ
jgi:serine/threonine protein kinase